MRGHTNRLHSRSLIERVQGFYPVDNKRLIEEINAIEQLLKYFKKKYRELDDAFNKFEELFIIALRNKRKLDNELNDIIKKIPWNDTQAKNTEEIRIPFAVPAVLFIGGIILAAAITVTFHTIIFAPGGPTTGMLVLGAILAIAPISCLVVSLLMLIHTCLEKEKFKNYDALHAMVNHSESGFNQYLTNDHPDNTYIELQDMSALGAS